MRGRIPESTLTEIRDRANIVEIVGAQVGLKRVGRNHVGLCPFHAEKSPSFTVNDERGIFHCFGCGAGGNVFTFLMKMENLQFPEVVERLARRFGITLPERGDDDPAIRQREALYRLNDKTAKFFQRYLWDAAEAEAARAYLHERGIGRETADHFLLGYAPGGGDVLARRLRDAIGSDPELGAGGQPLALAQQLGLVNERRGGNGHYDRFRARLMFPITDSAGRVVGFGSRSVPGTPSANGDLPKYLNSPETPLYRKGSHLYGLSGAREAIRKSGRAVVVEGYFDVLALAEAGVSHVVASLGTALTSEQLRVLGRFTPEIVAFFDGDAAGQNAAEKSLPIFLDAGLWGYGAFLPRGDDPDTYVRREGRDALLKLLDAAIPLFAFFLERVVPPSCTDAQRDEAAKRTADLLRRIKDEMKFEFAASLASRRLGLEGISEEVLRALSRGNPGFSAKEPPGVLRSASSPRSTSPPRKPGHAVGVEELLLTLVLQDHALVERIDAAGVLELLDEGPWRSLAIELIDAMRRGATLDSSLLLTQLDDASAARVAGRLLESSSDDPLREQILIDCLTKLRHRARERERLRVLRQIREAEARGDVDEVAEGQRQLQELRQVEASERP